jgi:hypothetical protein
MPTPTPSAPTPKPPTDSGGEASISDLAEGTPMLSTLVAALESQGLLETLMTGGAACALPTLRVAPSNFRQL